MLRSNAAQNPNLVNLCAKKCIVKQFFLYSPRVLVYRLPDNAIVSVKTYQIGLHEPTLKPCLEKRFCKISLRISPKWRFWTS